MYKDILVTGGEGMIGKELVRILEKQNKVPIKSVDIRNREYSIDLRNFNTCKEICFDADEVYHLAGIKGSPKMTKEKPADFMKMLQFDINMIYAAQECGVKKFLYTSSIAVENPQTDLYPAWAKMTAEKLIEAMRIQYPNGTKYCIVRPANVYGRYDDFDNPNAMVITSLISKAIEGDFEVWGDGTEIRDFINAKDVAKGMVKAMGEMPGFPVNLCSGKGVKLSKVIKIIEKETGNKAIYNLNKRSGDRRRVMKLNWDFTPTVSLKEGIREAIIWNKEN